eukprot:748196-Hanusia_phi.AAC.3
MEARWVLAVAEGRDGAQSEASSLTGARRRPPSQHRVPRTIRLRPGPPCPTTARPTRRPGAACAMHHAKASEARNMPPPRLSRRPPPGLPGDLL